MSSSNVGENGGGVFLGLLAIVFIVLKLTGQISWSWWWVLAPIWIPWAIILSVFVMAAIIAVISGMFK